ncbi:protein-tyrosine-phosphatase MKP1 isoform X1 [Cryptomeria japonica]|uniref:protein-tyrosine-phosphatase MKP1 isoform X1 n=1 Tax=Cryptomeria japonica TaxID=3369 RepID=UPI0027DA5AE4|nr:protein-tyrosine-phosphatase MKP1 isoform X1 [Cryptomeria japonica]
MSCHSPCRQGENLKSEVGGSVEGEVEEARENLVERDMVGEAMAVGVDRDKDSSGDRQIPNVRKSFWRSASWSSTRSAPPSPAALNLEKVLSSSTCSGMPIEVPNIPCRGLPLTPRSQQLSKMRSALPPLQPLNIARRSLEEWPKAGSDDIGEWLTPATPREKKDAGHLRNGIDVRLDLCSVPRNAEPSEMQLKRDKFAFFDKECSRVAEHVYLGSDAIARNREILRQNGITHVLNCVGFVCPEYFKKDLVYKTLWLQDSPCEDITSILYDVFDYFEEVREQGGRVFVHCYQGVSRSTSLVIAYLMWCKGQSFEDAFQYVKAARGITNPNMGFACQLLQCQKRVHADPLSPTSVLRMYRMAPHSPYDPLHLVSKILNNPGPAALDSRGAFIVHVPSAIYVWIGHSCEHTMAVAAKASAFQVVRYERAQGPIATVLEGEEKPEFWDALCNVRSENAEMGTSEVEKPLKGHHPGIRFRCSVGNKRVESYDVDFELYRRATVGGVVPPVPSSGAGSETHLPTRENGWGILRRKFMAGNVKELSAPGTMKELSVTSNMKELVAASLHTVCPTIKKEVECVKQDAQFLSTDISMPLVSPHDSPSSVSTEYKFSSKSPSPSPSSLPFTPSPSSSASWSPSSSCHSQSSVLDTVETFDRPINLSKNITKNSSLPAKSSSVSLAQRRGSVSPSLQLPVLGNDSFCGSKRMSKRTHDPLSAVANEMVAKGQTGQSGSSLSFPEELCTGSSCERESQPLYDNKVLQNGTLQFGEQYRRREHSPSESFPVSPLNTDTTWDGNPSSPSDVTDDESCPSRSKGKNNCKRTRPMLYDWPKLESKDMFDISYLDSSSVFILLAPNQTHHDDSGYVDEVYVWVGSELIADKESIQANSSDDRVEFSESDWKKSAVDFLERMDLQQDTIIRMYLECTQPIFWHTSMLYPHTLTQTSFDSAT